MSRLPDPPAGSRPRSRNQRFALPLDPVLTKAQLLEIFERVSEDRLPVDLLVAMVTHPSASDELLYHMLEFLSRDYAEAWNALAVIPRVQNDSRLRRWAVSGASAEGIEHLAPHCTPEDWAAIFTRITDPRWPSLNESATYILALATPKQLDAIGTDLWVRAALQRVSLPGLDLLAYVPSAWRDPRVRSRLEEFSDIRILPGIILHTQDCPLASRLFRRLSRENAHAAMKLLRDRPGVAAKFVRSDLEVFLGSYDPDVREAAFHALQYLLLSNT